MAEEKKILILEDEDSISGGIEYALSAQGIECVVARTLKEAVSHLDNLDSFFSIIVDLCLKGDRGEDFLTALDKKAFKNHVFLFSSIGDQALLDTEIKHCKKLNIRSFHKRNPKDLFNYIRSLKNGPIDLSELKTPYKIKHLIADKFSIKTIANQLNMSPQNVYKSYRNEFGEKPVEIK